MPSFDIRRLLSYNCTHAKQLIFIMIITADSQNLPIADSVATLVYCDPPWNMGMNEGKRSDRLSEIDYIKFIRNYLSEASRIMANNSWLVITLYNKIRFIHEYILYQYAELEFVQELIWYYNFGHYTRKMFVPCHDNILIYRKGNPKFHWTKIAIRSKRQEIGDIRADNRGRTPGSIIKVSRLTNTSYEKKFLCGDRRSSQPIELVKIFLNAYTEPGQLVVDMFSGSGTISKVCKQLNRVCMAFDICERYCKGANYRIDHGWKTLVSKDKNWQEFIKMK